MTNQTPQLSEDFFDYNIVKNQLYIRLMNSKENEVYLHHVPHIIVGDIALTYRIFLEYEDGIVSTEVTNDLVSEYGVSVEDLHFDTLKSAPNVMPIKIMNFSVDDTYNPPIFVLTNKYIQDGAASIFYPNVLATFAKGFDDDLVIIPLSTNECLVTTDTFSYEHNLKGVQEKLKDKEILQEYFLSSNIYHFNKETNNIETDEEYEKRVRESIKS